MRLVLIFFFSSRRRHTRSLRDWSSDVCSSDLHHAVVLSERVAQDHVRGLPADARESRQLLHGVGHPAVVRSEEHTSELQSRRDLVCRLLLEKKKKKTEKK